MSGSSAKRTSPLRLALGLLAAAALAPSAARAHNPDTSYARVEIAEREVRLRFTYEIGRAHV